MTPAVRTWIGLLALLIISVGTACVMTHTFTTAAVFLLVIGTTLKGWVTDPAAAMKLAPGELLELQHGLSESPKRAAGDALAPGPLSSS